jgi:ubiquinone/menaquinone biosynthesis C-methylase UbiE
MSVLDARYGAGDVSLLATRLIGPTGRVLGIDRSEDRLAFVRRRADALGYQHVTFRSGDLAAVALDSPSAP